MLMKNVRASVLEEIRVKTPRRVLELVCNAMYAADGPDFTELGMETLLQCYELTVEFGASVLQQMLVSIISINLSQDNAPGVYRAAMNTGNYTLANLARRGIDNALMLQQAVLGTIACTPFQGIRAKQLLFSIAIILADIQIVPGSLNALCGATIFGTIIYTVGRLCEIVDTDLPAQTILASLRQVHERDGCMCTNCTQFRERLVRGVNNLLQGLRPLFPRPGGANVVLGVDRDDETAGTNGRSTMGGSPEL
ncbi:hypothetical protein M422DRAFT_274220 [Sphaerobolus stellatus SS14]|uniref:Uncharacterized protein n=1 Tax=Sphaerobolus stellatus (strain SS14) TaxID=990650 RepID=A0A0C9T7E0_SPHS4|nr:hypothetical protein M422DRAFT_274220 [Sphaerobolus stellatus SS14]